MAFEFNDDNFSDEAAAGVVLIDFWAPWCGPCKMQGPIVEEVAQEMKDKAKVGKLNVDENHKTAQQFGVTSIPTLIVFKDGQAVAQMIGLQSKEAIMQQLNAQLA